MHCDLLIQNGTLIDGTGNPEYRADVAVSGERIVAVAPSLRAEARIVIEAGGHVVSPGFIDCHSHDDGIMLHQPNCEAKVLQGVTSEVIGNCGFTLGPLPADAQTYLTNVQRMMGGGEMPEELLQARTFGDYLDLLEQRPLGLNLVPLVGHAAIRIAAMGWDNRLPDARELERMKRLTEESMAAGAIGFSSGLIYVPATYAATDELKALAEVVGRFQGLYATHMRSEGDRQLEAIEEALAIGRAGGIPVHIGHHKIAGRANWGMSTQTLTRFEQARREEGLEITCDQYPYRAGSSYLAACLPPGFAGGGPDVWAAKLRDVSVREQVIQDIENDVGFPGDNLIRSGGFENIFISFSSDHPEYNGRSIAEIAAASGTRDYDVFFDLVSAEKMNVGMVVFMMDDRDIERIMQHPLTMVGSDGVPSQGSAKFHPRLTGTFPRVLGRFVREKKVLSLPEAVRKITSLPANTFRIRQRGLIKEGFFADLTIFDPGTIIDQGDYQNPDRQPAGIPYVICNGRPVVSQGKVTGAGSGKVLRREGG